MAPFSLPLLISTRRRLKRSTERSARPGLEHTPIPSLTRTARHMVSLRTLLAAALATAGLTAAAASDATPAAAPASTRVVGPTDSCQHANPALADAVFACPEAMGCLYQDGSACSGAYGAWDRAKGPCACVPAGTSVVVVPRGEPCGGAVADGKFVWCALVGPAEASESARGGRGACVHGNLEPCEPARQALFGPCQCHPRPGTGRLWGDNATILPAGAPCRAALTYRDTVCEDPTACTDAATGQACAREAFLGLLPGGSCLCKVRAE